MSKWQNFWLPNDQTFDLQMTNFWGPNDESFDVQTAKLVIYLSYLLTTEQSLIYSISTATL